MLLRVTVRSVGPARAGVDDRLRGSAAAVRAACALLLVAAAPLVPGATRSDLAAFGLLVTFGWIPVSTIACRRAARRPSRRLDAGILALDLALLLLAEVLLRPDEGALVAALVVPVAAATWFGGRAVGVLGAIAGVAFTAVVGAGAFTTTVYPAMLGVLAWLIDAAAADRRRTTADIERLDERSDAILTGVAEAVVVTDGTGRIDQWNRGAASTFGCEAGAARGRSCHDVLGLHHELQPLDCSGGCALLDVAAETEVEVWRWLAPGVRQPLLASVSPVVDDRGEVVEVVHSYRDITRVKQADEAKSLFLATASHELKTPLTVIRGFAQMLSLPEDVLGGDERRAALRAIEARADELAAVVDRLLLSSRIEAGRVDLEPQRVAVARVVRERADVLEAATGREVALELPDDLPDAWCDREALVTVLDHLLDNAVKYSPGRAPVVVTASAGDVGVELAVVDSGIGMTEDQAARCFDRFWQAEIADVRRFGGTGIGLYIARALVEGMGGTIDVASVLGGGSTFRIAFQRADVVETLRDSAAAAAP
jgi:PAS domain S-box-containing protein